MSATAANALVKEILDDEDMKELPNGKVWANFGNGAYTVIHSANDVLPAGEYEVSVTPQNIKFIEKKPSSDELMFTTKNSMASKLSKEIEAFWGKADTFKQHGFLHRRGYLLHGKPGCGKTCLIKQITTDFVEKDGIVIHAEGRINNVILGVNMLRSAEAKRRILVVFEDVEEICAYSETELLSFLDGADQTEHLISLGTTNYLSSLPERVVGRPRRFDRVVEIKPPDSELRREYFGKKLGITDEELEEWVSNSNGFSFAAMSDLVISVKCLDQKLEKAAASLRTLLKEGDL